MEISNTGKTDQTPILITGAAGFIGFHVAHRLLTAGKAVVGVDNINNYYDPDLKKARLAKLIDKPQFEFVRLDLANRQETDIFLKQRQFKTILHLAAQAGVRYSVDNPYAYLESNLVAFMNVLECCRQYGTAHLIYASSSSVYGSNEKQPFSILDHVDKPVSLYAATKKANELMAHAYSSLYKLKTTGLRFFTVYGPWGRPDMAYFHFTKSIIERTPISLFNYGAMKRDFTYIDDVVDVVIRIIKDDVDKPDKSSIYNIGNNQPESLLTFVETLEKKIGAEAIKRLLPVQAGDVISTYADVSETVEDFGFAPSTALKDGLSKFVDWYRCYYGA